MSDTERSSIKMEEAKDKVIGAIAETMDLYGVTPAAANLYATMYFKDQMTLDEMRTELGMSKPSMSTSVRRLQEIDMVKKHSPEVPGNIRMQLRKISSDPLCRFIVRCGNVKRK